MTSYEELGTSFRTAQGLALGLSKRELAELVEQGVLLRPSRGRYRKVPGALTGDSAHRHLLMDELSVLGPEWHAALRTAAVLYDLPVLGQLPARPQLLRDSAGARTRGEDEFRGVGTLPPEHRVLLDGVRTVTPARLAVDIARVESFRSGLVVADAVLGLGVPRRQLEAVLATMVRWPGVRQAREVVRLADGLSESALETLSRWVFLQAGVRSPQLQVEIYLGQEYLLRADKLWLPEGVVGEDDGLAKFGADAGSRQSAFRRTKRTQDRLEEAGLIVARWGWDEAFRQSDALVHRLESALRRARPAQLDPRLSFRVTSVEDRLARAERYRSRPA